MLNAISIIDPVSSARKVTSSRTSVVSSSLHMVNSNKATNTSPSAHLVTPNLLNLSPEALSVLQDTGNVETLVLSSTRNLITSYYSSINQS